MRKKLGLFIAAIGIIVVGVVAFLAFESYTLDIQAHLEPVLSVNPHGDWDLGTVYPETDVSTKLFVGLSNSAKADGNFQSVAYTLACQKKPVGDGTPADALSLCPNIEVAAQTVGIGSAQCGLGPLVDDPNSCKLFNRSIVRGDNYHGYSINILWPDCIGTVQKDPGFTTKAVDCNRDPATGKFAGVDLAAIISIAVGDIVQTQKCILDKDGNPLQTCVKDKFDNLVDCDGIGTTGRGCTAANQEVSNGDDLHAWPAPGQFGPEGIDTFDLDGSGGWTKKDAIHLEGDGLGANNTNLNGACVNGDRTGVIGDPPIHDAGDCVVLDLNNDLAVGRVVDCDLETGTFCTGTMISDLKFHDDNGDNAWNNGEDIVWDRDGDGIFN